VFEDLQWADQSTLELLGLAPEVVYEFKHALMKDAAY
jgi:predicted ATPase